VQIQNLEEGLGFRPLLPTSVVPFLSVLLTPFLILFEHNHTWFVANIKIIFS